MPRVAWPPAAPGRNEWAGADIVWDPRRVRSTGDDTPATSLVRYVWRMSGWHQAGLVGIALVSAGLSVLPIQLQQRIIDDAIRPGDMALLGWLVGAYAAVIVGQQVVKVILRAYQAWIGYSAIAYTRQHFSRTQSHPDGEPEPSGEQIAILTTETEKLGRFVGSGPSDAVVSLATIVALLAYMAAVEPIIVLASLPLLLAQVFSAPIFQRRLDRLIERRLGAVRRMADTALTQAKEVADAEDGGLLGRRVRHIFNVSMWLELWKIAMKATINAIGALGPLAVLAIGGWLTIRGDTTIGVVVAFMSGFTRLTDPMREVIMQYRQYAQARVQHQMIADTVTGAVEERRGSSPS